MSKLNGSGKKTVWLSKDSFLNHMMNKAIANDRSKDEALNYALNMWVGYLGFKKAKVLSGIQQTDEGEIIFLFTKDGQRKAECMGLFINSFDAHLPSGDGDSDPASES